MLIYYTGRGKIAFNDMIYKPDRKVSALQFFLNPIFFSKSSISSFLLGNLIAEIGVAFSILSAAKTVLLILQIDVKL